jgi:hypothetical protein
MLCADLLLGLLFDPEDGGSISLRKGCIHLQDCGVITQKATV